MFKISILILLFLSGCGTNSAKNNTNDKNDPPISESNSKSINQVEITSKGGMQGVLAYCKITKDSVITEFSLSTNPSKNYSFREINNIVDWENFINKIDLENFKKGVNGKSTQPMDGVDTEIKIKTNNEEISKINADPNKTWVYILGFIDRYFKQ